jgi:hypothetical protein
MDACINGLNILTFLDVISGGVVSTYFTIAVSMLIV